MSDLIEFLSARLDEDAAEAQKDIWCAERASNGGDWQASYGHDWPYSTLRAGREIGRLTARRPPSVVGEWDQHEADAMLVERMVRSAKARAEQRLREVEAKRRILDEYAALAANPERLHDAAMHMAYTLLGNVVRLQVQPYAEHPDYQDEWRP